MVYEIYPREVIKTGINRLRGGIRPVNLEGVKPYNYKWVKKKKEKANPKTWIKKLKPPKKLNFKIDSWTQEKCQAWINKNI